MALLQTHTIDNFRLFDLSYNCAVALLQTLSFNVFRLLNESYDRAVALLQTHSEGFKKLAEALIEQVPRGYNDASTCGLAC